MKQHACHCIFFCKNYVASYTQIFSPKANNNQIKHKASFCFVHTFSGTPCLWKYKQYWGKGVSAWLGRKLRSHRPAVLEGRSTFLRIPILPVQVWWAVGYTSQAQLSQRRNQRWKFHRWSSGGLRVRNHDCSAGSLASYASGAGCSEVVPQNTVLACCSPSRWPS